MEENEDIDELGKGLRKLKPSERIKKLKELGKKKKEEITKIEDLIKDFEKEIKIDSVAEDITPKARGVYIANLFEEENAELEATVKKEAPNEEETAGYISIKRAYGDYTELRDIQYSSIMGSLTNKQINAMDRIGERLDRTRYQSQSAEVADILVASRATLYKIRKYAGLQ